MQKCYIINKIKQFNKRRPSAGAIITSTIAGTMTSLILLALATFVSSNATFAATSTLSLSVSGSVSLDIASLSADGAFASSSTSDTTVSITTSNASGYTLGIAASTANDNALKYTESGTTIATIPSITNAVSASNYADDTYATTNNLNNTWGFRPSKYNSVDNTTTNNYYPGPTSTSAITLDATSVANPSTANNYNIAIGSRIDSTQAVGSYSNTFVITAVANAIPYTITYNQNTTDTVTDLPSNVSTTTYDETVPISNTIPVRDGYSFKGWCTAQTADGESCADVSGTTYNPDGAGTDLTWTLNQTSTTNTLTLYAMWESAEPPCSAGYICYNSNAGNDTVYGVMDAQNVGTSATSAMLMAYNYKRVGSNGKPTHAFLGWSTVANPVIGTDTIYGPMEDITFSALTSKGLNLYAVWLPKSTTYTMQNFSSSTCSSQLTQITYNSSSATFTVSPNSFIALEDTRDHDVYTVARLSDGNCWMLENLRLNESATGINTNALSQGGASFTISALPTSTNSFTTSDYTTIQYNKNNTDIENSSLTPSYNTDNATSKWYGYGNYYTWAAARGTTSSLSSGNTSTSLCPANWHMPYGGSGTGSGGGNTSGGFYYLASSMSATGSSSTSSNRLRQFPNNFVYSGRWGGSSVRNRGSYGHYWSSTAYDSNRAYALIFDSLDVSPGTNRSYKYFGFSVRCVAGS